MMTSLIIFGLIIVSFIAGWFNGHSVTKKEYELQALSRGAAFIHVDSNGCNPEFMWKEGKR